MDMNGGFVFSDESCDIQQRLLGQCFAARADVFSKIPGTPNVTAWVDIS